MNNVPHHLNKNILVAGSSVSEFLDFAETDLEFVAMLLFSEMRLQVLIV